MQNNYLMPDYAVIGTTAQILATSEMRLSELAYQQWFGQTPQRRDLERAFLGYLFDGEMPCWIRGYTRQTLQLCAESGVELPLIPDGHGVTLSVSLTEMSFALLWLGVVCLMWIGKLL